MMSQRALICSWYMPQPDLDSYSRRLFHFVEFLHDAGWSVTCIAETPTGVRQFGAALAEMDVPVHVRFEHIERLLRNESFDLAILGFWSTGEKVIRTIRHASPSTRIIVDSGDLHFLRHARRLLLDGGDNNDLNLLDQRYSAETTRELNVYAAADAVFAVSRKEAEFVGDFVGDARRSHFVPDCEDLPASPVPLADRRGLFFVGNFQHQPNVEALKFLCGEILPQFDPGMLVDHPVYIAGNAMTDALQKLGDGLPFVRMVGWVPSVEPYLNRARVSIVPLLHGAGTKRKTIQALSTGTPTVSTSVGIEGFNLRDQEEVLVADDPVKFANAIGRLLIDDDLWRKLAVQGRGRILADHSRPAGRKHFLTAIARVIEYGPRRAEVAHAGSRASAAGDRDYRSVIRRLHAMVDAAVPPTATVLVVSRGDDALLALGERNAWHFPRAADGSYTGYHPKDSEDAIARVEHLRQMGADFLVFPSTADWWFDHYEAFTHHLERHCRIAARDASCGIIFALKEPADTGARVRLANATPAAAPLRTLRAPFDLETHRPALPTAVAPASIGRDQRRPSVVVVGVYLADRPNTVDDIVRILAETSACEVTQRWVAIGSHPAPPHVTSVTDRVITQRTPKFTILNDLLARAPIADADYVLLCDDDVVLPHGFLDRFVARQTALGFALAQPALTEGSYVNHPLVERQRGVIARQTQFVEIGPVVSIHRSALPLMVPFDLTSPMGWGYEEVWAARLSAAGLTMGIIDEVPVDHGLRESVSHYGWDEANQQRHALLATLDHPVLADPFRLLAVSASPAPGAPASIVRTRPADPGLRISVVIPTHNRATLLDQSLASLSRQTLPPSQFEVIVIDDGSVDETGAVCDRWAAHLPLTRLRIDRSGIAAAKNLGVFAAAAPIILFFDDDDVADPALLAEHLATHERYPLPNVAVLGHTDWAPELEVTEVMRYVTDVGHYLFSYTGLPNDARLDFTYFWGGRTSCKKALLTRTGVFRQQFEFGSEDIELGFRISKLLVQWQLLHHPFEAHEDDPAARQQLATVGLVVVYNRNAAQHMNRAVTYDEFCRRCERQGRSQHQFSRMYADSLVHQWGQTTGAEDRWEQLRGDLPGRVARVHELERSLASAASEAEGHQLRAELHQHYRWTFDAYKTKGIVEAMADD